MQLTPLNFYVQRILPLAMDDSLSYYETLLKIRNKLNDVVSAQNGLSDNFGQVETAFAELEKYVKDYFDNLDLSEETKAILDRMAANGEFAQIVTGILAHYFNPVFVDNESDMTAGKASWSMNSNGENKIFWYRGNVLTDSGLIFKGYIDAQSYFPETPENARDCYCNIETNLIYSFSPVSGWIPTGYSYQGHITSPVEAVQGYNIYVLKSNSHIYAYDTANSKYTDTGVIYGVSNSSFLFRRALTTSDSAETISQSGWYSFDFTSGKPSTFPAVEGTSGFLLCFADMPYKYLLMFTRSGEMFIWRHSQWRHFPYTDITLTEPDIPADALVTGTLIKTEQTRAEAAENTLQENINAEQERAQTAENAVSNNLQSYVNMLVNMAEAETEGRTAEDENLQTQISTLNRNFRLMNYSLATQSGETLTTQNTREIQSALYAAYFLTDTTLTVDGEPADAKATGDAIRTETEAREYADNILDAKVSGESEMRVLGDNQLKTRIDTGLTAEQQARETADTALQESVTANANNIDKLESQFIYNGYSITSNNNNNIITQNGNDIETTLCGVFRDTTAQFPCITSPHYLWEEIHATQHTEWGYRSFSTGVVFCGKQIHASRASYKHLTDNSREKYGNIVFHIIDANWNIKEQFLDVDYQNLSGELRDPNLSVLVQDSLLLLSCFTTDGAVSQDSHGNFMAILDKNLQVIDILDAPANGYIFWGNTLLTPQGYLLKCEYDYIYNLTKCRVIKTTEKFNGTLKNISWEPVAEFTGIGCPEPTICYWRNKLVLMARGGLLCYTDDSEGLSGWQQLSYPYDIHAVAFTQISNDNYLIGFGSYKDSGNRYPCAFLVDVPSGNIYELAIMQNTPGFGGYPSIVRISPLHYSTVYWMDLSSGGSHLYHTTFNVLKIPEWQNYLAHYPPENFTKIQNG